MHTYAAGKQAGGEATDDDEWLFGLQPQLSLPPCYMHAFLMPLRFLLPRHLTLLQVHRAYCAGSHPFSQGQIKHLLGALREPGLQSAGYCLGVSGRKSVSL